MQRDSHVPVNDGLVLSLSPPTLLPMPPPVVVVATAAVHHLGGTLSPHTQAKTNLRSGATVDARVQTPPGETGDKRPRPGSVSPQAPNDESSSQEETYEEEEDRLCYYVWGISSVTFITIIIPLGLFVLSHSTTGTQTDQPRTTPNSTAGSSHLPDPQLCAMPLLSDTSPALPPSPRDRPQIRASTPRPGFQFRDVLCVLDIKYHIKRPPYSPIYLPLPYCSKLIASSFAVVDDRLVAKRGKLDTAYLGELVNMNQAGRLVHRRRKVPIYMTVGGDRADSANISKALRDPASRKRLAAFVVNYTNSHIISGVHLDWDHPGARCGDPHDAANLKNFIVDLQAMKKSNVMLSVPPSPDLVDLYNLNQIMDMLKLVIVKTHTLRPDKSLACTGERADAHEAFMAIRANLSGIYHDKLAYSIQVGVDKFEPNGALSAATDPTSGHPGRTTYSRVCDLYPDVQAPLSVECRLGTFADYDKEYQVAFAGPRELLARMRNTYADGMGSVPVVVHGIDLDDFLGSCPGGVTSPLIRAIATGGP